MKRSNITLILKKDIEKIYTMDIDLLQSLYSLEYINDIELIKFIINEFINGKKKIFNYCNKAKETFDIDRWKDYCLYKKEKPSDSGSEKYYKLVYGDNWMIYKQIIKNKKSNIYDPNYISKRDNISYDDAIKYIEKYKKDKATSKEGFIKRNGFDKGIEKFKKFQKTSNIFDIENINRIYGDENTDEILKERIKNNRKHSPWCVEYWNNKGYYGDRAIEKVKEYQNNNSGVSFNAILNRCIGDIEKANKIYNDINSKKDSSSYAFFLEITSYNIIEADKLYENRSISKDHRSMKNFSSFEEYIKYNENISEKSLNTLVSKGLAIPKKLRDEYSVYVYNVEKHTKRSLKYYGNLKFGNGYEKLISPTTNHIDHIISKFDGFKNGIDVEIIGNIENLQILNYKINISKNKNSWISIEELFERIENSKLLKNKI